MLSVMKCHWQTLSLFYPVFNESQALPGLISTAVQFLDTLDLEKYEVIIVDDGSDDGTGKLADKLTEKYSQVKVVHHPVNLGYGAALASGFQAAKFAWVAYNDGDGQFDIADLQKFIEPSKRVDVVLGYRRHRSDHFGRRLNAWIWGRVVELILKLRVRDIDCGFKLIRASVLSQIEPIEAKGAVISPELLLKLQMAGAKWEEVAVEHFPRRSGVASGARPSVILRAFWELIWLRRSLK